MARLAGPSDDRAPVVGRRRVHRHEPRRLEGARPQHSARVRALSRDRRRHRAVLRAHDVTPRSSPDESRRSSSASPAESAAASRWWDAPSRARGVEIADADEAAHAVSARGAAGHALVVAAFGPGPSARTANSTGRGCGTASSPIPHARARLESILHPLITNGSTAPSRAGADPTASCLVPLLLERGGVKGRVARVLVVDCPEDEQVRRVVARSGLTPDGSPRDHGHAVVPRRAARAADDVIDNGGAIGRHRAPGGTPPRVLPRMRGAPPRPARQPALESSQNGAQQSNGPHVIRYEHPLNERVRTLMRLEDLFARVGYFAAQDAALDHHSALLALFEITEVAARADLKTDILQELERQKQMLAPLAEQSADRAERARGAARADRADQRTDCSRRRARSVHTCARTNG